MSLFGITVELNNDLVHRVFNLHCVVKAIAL